MVLPSSLFKHTNKKITPVGLGGEGILRTSGNDRQALKVIEAAIDQGITYCDSARVYMDSELYYGQFWQKNSDKRDRVFQTSKSASRTRQGAWDDLTQTLNRLSTDYLDLWQIHDVRDEKDLEQISQKGGALEAFVQAKEKGLVKHIGVTGHHDPQILTRAVEQWPVDSVLMPVNPVEDVMGGFLTQTLEAAHKKGIAVIGMKVLGGKHYIAKQVGLTAGILIRYAASFDICLAIVGCSTPEEVEELAHAGLHEPSLTINERNEIMALYRKDAQRLAFYRGSTFKKFK